MEPHCESLYYFFYITNWPCKQLSCSSMTCKCLRKSCLNNIKIHIILQIWLIKVLLHVELQGPACVFCHYSASRLIQVPRWHKTASLWTTNGHLWVQEDSRTASMSMRSTQSEDFQFIISAVRKNSTIDSVPLRLSQFHLVCRDRSLV